MNNSNILMDYIGEGCHYTEYFDAIALAKEIVECDSLFEFQEKAGEKGIKEVIKGLNELRLSKGRCIIRYAQNT
mgnify:CR=1 FL=1|tara:strand:+ start:4270 stop:4491 length:222 start_codon:yes stop_codon:yes gene_type:complete